MCESRQVNDQVICGPCGLQWDVNDTDPPVCQHKKGLRTKVVNLVRRLEGVDTPPIFNPGALVNHIAARTLSRADFTMCMEIARQAYAQGQKDLK